MAYFNHAPVGSHQRIQVSRSAGDAVQDVPGPSDSGRRIQADAPFGATTRILLEAGDLVVAGDIEGTSAALADARDVGDFASFKLTDGKEFLLNPDAVRGLEDAAHRSSVVRRSGAAR